MAYAVHNNVQVLITPAKVLCLIALQLHTIPNSECLSYQALYHFDTSDQRNIRAHVYHIAQLTSLKNLIIGNGGCTLNVQLHRE